MRLGKGKWGNLEMEEGKLKMTREIRMPGYRIDTERKWKEHVEYWAERGMGVRRNVSNMSIWKPRWDSCMGVHKDDKRGISTSSMLWTRIHNH